MYNENHDKEGKKIFGGNFAKNKITEEPSWFPFHPHVYDIER